MSGRGGAVGRVHWICDWCETINFDITGPCSGCQPDRVHASDRLPIPATWCDCGHAGAQHDDVGCMFGWDEIPVPDDACECERFTGGPTKLPLTDFLLARIAEDEAGTSRSWRVKRDSLALHVDQGNGYCRACHWAAPCMALRGIGTAYAAHPDYREEWKP